jgi:hypothetical protein
MSNEADLRQLARELAAATALDKRTVTAWLIGERVRDSCALALSQAVERFELVERVEKCRGAAA